METSLMVTNLEMLEMEVLVTDDDYLPFLLFGKQPSYYTHVCLLSPSCFGMLGH